ncbi:tetratricopeptide repeat protein [Amycolatopsis sp. RTGN1]|uniref:tetratricopeptide repeat protein n=1 Tax=Amycolatopsis ponsaeliensis TaxID=2992142 RepID=UPI00254F44B9|nr:tetratricopeptide repeat protein [Amycolatopsis sp. RTGN1]
MPVSDRPDDATPSDALAALAAAQDLHNRYVSSGALDVLQAHAALETYGTWLAALPAEHSQRRVIAAQAVLVMRGLTEATDDQRWLDWAINLGKDALDESNDVVLQSCLASVLSARSRLTGSLDDIDEAIELRRRVIDGSAEADADRSAALRSNLAADLRMRAELMQQPTMRQRLEALQDRITRYYIHADTTAILEEPALGGAQALYDIAKRETGGTPVEIALALAELRWARHHALGEPADGPDLPTALRIFGSLAGHDPDLLPEELVTGPLRGSPETLKTMAEIRRKVVATTREGHPEHAQRLDGLVSALWMCIHTTAGTSELDELIELRRASSTGDDAVLLNDLGLALRLRFERGGAETDLDEAVDVGRQAVASLPPGLAGRSALLGNLAAALLIRFRTRRAGRDLDEAIAICEEHQLPALGIALKLSFEVTGRIEDLDRAIGLARAAVNSERSRPLNRAQQLSNLSNMLLRRYEQFGIVTDLDNAIAAGSEAAELPLNNADRALYLCNLGAMLQTRFIRGGNRADLDCAERAGTQAHTLAPPKSPVHTTCLSTLCNTLHVRALATGADVDFGRAVDAARQLLNATQPRHAERARRLSNVASLLTDRFRSTQDTAHLDDAVAAGREATEIAGIAPPDRARFELILARALTLTERDSDTAEAMTLARQAAQNASTPARLRALGAQLWAGAAADRADWATAREGILTAVSLLPVLVDHSLRRADSEHLLSELTGLSGQVAAIALTTAGSAEALRLTEQTRGLIWTRLLELHTDLARVRQISPALAERLDMVSRELARQ